MTVETLTHPEAPATLRFCPNPVFVIGSPRSGTSALAWALAEHPSLWTRGETQLLIDLFGDGRLERNYLRRSAPDGSFLDQVEVEREEFLAYIGAGLNALLTDLSGGRRWIDKTPGYTLMVDTVADMFPGAVFLHMLRDGRRVVHSMVNFAAHRSRARYRALKEPWMTDFRVACRTWRDHVEAARRFEAARPGRCLAVVAEELLRDPDGGFRRILAYLGELSHDAPATTFRTRRIHSSFVPEPLRDGTNPAQVAKLLGPGPWAEWTDKQRAIFVEEAGPTMVDCGLATEEELSG